MESPSISFYIVGTVVAALLYLYLHLTRNFKYWKNQNIPYVPPTVLFGNIFNICTFQKCMGEFMSDLYNRSTSKILGFFVFDQPFLFIRDPDLIKQLLVKDFEYFSDRTVVSNGENDQFASKMLFTVKNPMWRNLRIKLTPAFTSGKIKNMTALMTDASKGLIGYIDNKLSHANEFDARNLTMMYTTDVISSCVFGIAANSFNNENAEFRAASKKIFELTLTRAVHSVSSFLAPMLFKTFKMRFLDPSAVEFMQKAFIETLHEREKSKEYRGDLIDILVQIKNNEESGSDFDENTLVAQAIQFFAAGFESTGSTSFYCLYELSKNKRVQENLRQEIKSVLKGHKQITYDLIQEMSYLDMVIHEILRKYPILPFVDRQCTKTYRIPDTDVIVKKGMKIYISLTGLHYDSNYFPDPEKFIPERFSPENRSNITSNVYMPFGKGLHNCIGERFALMSVKVGITSLLSNYEVDLCSNSESVENVKYNSYGYLLAPVSKIYMKFNSKPLFDNDLYMSN